MAVKFIIANHATFTALNKYIFRNENEKTFWKYLYFFHYYTDKYNINTNVFIRLPGHTQAFHMTFTIEAWSEFVLKIDNHLVNIK